MCKRRPKLKITNLTLPVKFAAKLSVKSNLITISARNVTTQQSAKNVVSKPYISDASQDPNSNNSMAKCVGNATTVKS